MPTSELDRGYGLPRSNGTAHCSARPGKLPPSQDVTNDLGRLHHVFECSADRNPDAIALIHGRERLTYSELDSRANQLARYLKRQGIKQGARLGLLLDRSANTYVSLLAALKCGCAFVPMDQSFPRERIAFVAEDAKLDMLLTVGGFRQLVEGVGCRVLDLDWASEAIALEPTRRLALSESGDSLCYIIYTSGTTGRPKGVAINHSSIVNFLNACLPIYAVKPSDRVYQGMTLAFDFSVEEIWPTFAAGATLVAGPDDHRKFGSALADFLIQQQISVMCCVPTLLATLDRDVPTLRLLLVGGEACPADLVRRWSKPGRRLLNTYGPTEATVTASWGELSPDKPVTIGRPMPTYAIYILDESLRPVSNGDVGEICIGGPGVAVGYLNRPELTAERFVTDGISGATGARLYRTGDLGRLTPAGEIEYLGRADQQVKIRGYRVELSEIEKLLLEDDAVANAVVTLWSSDGGITELTAYVVFHHAVDHSEMRLRLHARLRQQLPAYMVPAFIEPIDAIPMLASNKADRSRLPRPASPRLATGVPGDADLPLSPLELEITDVWSRVFGQSTLAVEADFFLDLGGHSMFAAMAVSELRQRRGLQGVSIGDIYAHPTIRGLARHLEKQFSTSGLVSPAELQSEFKKHSSGRVWLGGGVQMALLYAALLPWLVPTLLMILLLTESSASGWQIVAGLAGLAAAMPLMTLILPVLAKWLLLGKVKPGRHPLWGWFFCRWWLVRKLLQTAPLDFLAGSPLLAPYLRLLGARIGRDCHLGTARIDLPDLIEIGDGASIGYDVDLDPAHVANGWLTIAPLRIGADAYVGTNSVISGGGIVGQRAMIAEQSLVACGQSIPAGETWAGSPSRPTSSDPQLDLLCTREGKPRWSIPLLAGFFVSFLALQMLPLLLIVPGLVLVWGVSEGDLGIGLALTPVAGLLQVLATCGLVVLGKRLALPALKPGIYPLRSSFGLRKWLADRLMVLSLGMTNSLYSTLYLLPFLRLLGTRVGPRAEVSTVAHIDPDLLTLGTECFVADLAVIGAARFCNGFVILGETSIGERTFIGNAALVPGDTRLAHDSLIGVLSVTPPHPVGAGTSWLGSPAIFLPRRQASEKFDESLTYRPPFRLVVCRLAIEFLRVVLPSTLGFVAMLLLALSMLELLEDLSPVVVLLLAPAVYLAIGLVVTVITAALKWCVMGRYRPRVEPQWSHFVWRTEFITGLYENAAVPWLIHWLAGTPLMAPALRLFGAKVGRRVYLDTTYLTEFDLVRVGDDAAVSGQAALQTHLFEDRVMKMSTVTVGAGCSVGPRSVILYDSELAPEAQLDALSLVMKGEKLPPESCWRGVPALLVDIKNRPASSA